LTLPFSPFKPISSHSIHIVTFSLGYNILDLSSVSSSVFVHYSLTSAISLVLQIYSSSDLYTITVSAEFPNPSCYSIPSSAFNGQGLLTCASSALAAENMNHLDIWYDSLAGG
jgi:hypothetical protein